MGLLFNKVLKVLLDSNADSVLYPGNSGRVGSSPAAGDLIICETLGLIIARGRQTF